MMKSRRRTHCFPLQTGGRDAILFTYTKKYIPCRKKEERENEKDDQKLALMLLLAALLLTMTGCSATDYKTAKQLMESGDAAAAAEMFKTLGDYKDSASLATACDYTVAKSTYGAGEYEQARALFAALGDYEDSAELVTACDYALARNAYDTGEYEKAAELFAALGDYQDSAAMAVQSGDRALAEKLLGSWVSNELDVTAIFTQALYTAIDDEESSKALLDCMDLGTLTLKYSLEFTDKGTFVMSAENGSAAALINTFYTAFTDGLVIYLEKEIQQDADTNGYSVEELLQAYGCTTTRELIEAMLEMSLDDFMASILSKESLQELIDNSTFNGVYSVENGEIDLTIGRDQSIAVYDESSDTFSLVDEEIAGTAIVFSRA